MTDIQAALGISQLERLGEIVDERNKQLDIYRSLLTSLPLKLLDVSHIVVSSVHLAVIRLLDVTPQHRFISNISDLLELACNCIIYLCTCILIIEAKALVKVYLRQKLCSVC